MEIYGIYLFRKDKKRLKYLLDDTSKAIEYTKKLNDSLKEKNKYYRCNCYTEDDTHVCCDDLYYKTMTLTFDNDIFNTNICQYVTCSCFIKQHQENLKK